MAELLSGNAAIARGAYEAGAVLAAGYPGTPSTEILENAVKYKDDIYLEWAPNEKVALEVGAAAAMGGTRSIVTMKHVGLNVAADPLMTLAYIGVEGGLVICVADDPGMHSSQNEQDTRNYAKFARLPIFEPTSSQEAKDFVAMAMEVSEKHKTPVLLRSTTRVSHSRSLVELGERQEHKSKGFQKDVQRFVTVPAFSRQMRLKVEKRTAELKAEAESSPANKIEMGDKSLGIIACGITYQYVKEVWPEASVLKLGFSQPWPDDLIGKFAGDVDKLLVVEELDPLLEEHIKAMGIECHGRDAVSGIGELSVSTLRESRAKLEGRPAEKPAYENNADKLPGRPPVLCAGCPHRGVFYALTKHDVVVAGDIGCYSLGAFKPLERLDIILCMGGGVSMAHGLDKAGEKKKVVGIVGDSTFFHSGITGLLDIAYNKGKSTIIVVDNRTTAMTGHQDHPGTGRTLMGEPTVEASIEDIGRACGIKRIRTLNPYDQQATQKALDEEINADEASLVISKAPCILHDRSGVKPALEIDSELCKNCRMCLKLGCPAIEASEGEKPSISSILCTGCGLCRQICKFGAISGGENE
ncbi:6-hydroxynicotinate reductase [Sedimentisphaera cyanobacteriorum]|uniref:Indolepyruvate oxidoreductase subunit IorA n=1 Tax=Sedimentisphaera cyanobacteriorum TaxID=1940790 RepID=A0A1Q2HPH6_9BACT|nr:indolepyruvate ferredoxin oxidoreductase subunit alpha [Sedimentisphaera cyanobacteriorum]AQQ09369.1 6-hydroxynicotinate reductase [Sedimentisphaera cyanobacteriorum]